MSKYTSGRLLMMLLVLSVTGQVCSAEPPIQAASSSARTPTTTGALTQTNIRTPAWGWFTLFAANATTTSLALGDMNGDGALDIVRGNMEQPNEMLLGFGQGHFNTETSLPGNPRGTTSVVLGDLNNDGALDVVWGNMEFESQVLLGDGQGHFPTQIKLPGGVRSTKSVALGDLNGDGMLDVVRGNADMASDVLLGDGQGRFRAPIDLPGGARGTNSVVLGDLNNDGVLDIVRGNVRMPSDVLLGDGQGRFRAPVDLPGGVHATKSVALGDLNSDGVLDIVRGNADKASDVLLGYGQGLFGIPIELPGYAAHATSVALGDLNGDDALDIVRGNADAANDVLLGDGRGHFDALIQQPGSVLDTTSVALGDLNGDSVLDIVRGNWGSSGDVLLGGGQSGFATPVDLPGDPLVTTSVLLGDLNRDGRLDVVRGHSNAPDDALLGDGQGHFGPPIELLGGPRTTTSMVLGDVNGDGVLDVVRGASSGAGEVLLGDGQGRFGAPVELPKTLDGLTSVVLGDLNRDGWLDVVRGSARAASDVLLGNGQGRFGAPVELPGGTHNTTSLAVGDLNRDGVLDIVRGNAGEASDVLLGNGQGGFGAPLQIQAIYNTTSVALADLNGDGVLDIVLGNSGFDSVYSLGKARGGFLGPVEIRDSTSTTLPNTKSVALGDLNGDVVLDIVRGSEGMVSDFSLGSGIRTGAFAGSFGETSELPGGPRNTKSVALGDLNGDGVLDIVRGNSRSSDVLLGIRVNHVVVPPLPASRACLPNSADTTKDLPQIQVFQPDAVPPANFLAHPTIHNASVISIPYTLSDPQGSIVVRVQGFYSLNGGGLWQPATPTRVTTLCHRLTQGSKSQFVFGWDRMADRVMGRYDNVVFRIEVIPVFQQQPNQAAPLYHAVSTGRASWPFRVWGLPVRVLQPDGQPVADAQIYRLSAGQLRGGQLFPPQLPGQPQWLTDAQGWLKGHGVLTPTDRLVALAPISTTDTYTLYLSSAAPTPAGLDLHQIRSSGVQTLTIRPERPLLLFNLKVALEWDARNDQVFHTQLETNLKRASELLFRWSGGQVALGTLQVFNNAEHWNDAHIRLYATNRMRPNADQGGITSTAWPGGARLDPDVPDLFYPPGQLRIGASWNRLGDPQAGVGEDWARTLAHELGHYALFLNDNYLGYRNGRLVSLDACPGPMTDPYRDDYSDFRATSDWLPGCQFTLSQLDSGRADWATIKTFYDAPALGFHLNAPPRFAPDANPNLLPLAVTQVRFDPAFADPVALPLSTPVVVLRNADGTPFILGSGMRAVLYRNAQLIDLGVSKGEELLARGAHAGDQVCVYALDQQRMGCQHIQDNYAQLTLQPMGNWRPDLLVVPVSAQQLQISVRNLVPDDSLAAQLYSSDGAESLPLLLTSDGAGGYQTTVVVSDALKFEGAVRLWEGMPHTTREIVQDVRVGSNPGPIFRRARYAPVLSADGQAVLYTNALALANGQYFTLQATDSMPPLPIWGTRVSRAYRLTASPGLNLMGSSLNIGYLSQDGLPKQEKDILIAWWDAAAKQWRPLQTEVDTKHREATSSITQPGIYMLLTRTTIELDRAGWNRFDFYPGATQAVTDALTTIAGRFTSIYGYDVQDSTNPWRIYDRTVPEPWSGAVNDLTTLRYGDGYWIYATEPVSWFVRSGTSTFGLQASVPLVQPPATYYGLAPAAGLALEARVGNVICARTQTMSRSIAGKTQPIFVLKVRAAGDGSPECGAPGRPVSLIFHDGTREVQRMTVGWDNRWAHQIPFPTYLPTVRR